MTITNIPWTEAPRVCNLLENLFRRGKVEFEKTREEKTRKETTQRASGKRIPWTLRRNDDSQIRFRQEPMVWRPTVRHSSTNHYYLLQNSRYNKQVYEGY